MEKSKEQLAAEIFSDMVKSVQPRHSNMPGEWATFTELTAKMPFEECVWNRCKPDKELANLVLEEAARQSNAAWEEYWPANPAKTARP